MRRCRCNPLHDGAAADLAVGGILLRRCQDYVGDVARILLIIVLAVLFLPLPLLLRCWLAGGATLPPSPRRHRRRCLNWKKRESVHL